MVRIPSALTSDQSSFRARRPERIQVGLCPNVDNTRDMTPGHLRSRNQATGCQCNALVGPTSTSSGTSRTAIRLVPETACGNPAAGQSARCRPRHDGRAKTFSKGGDHRDVRFPKSSSPLVAVPSRTATSLTLPCGVGTDSHPKGTGGVSEVQSGASSVFVERIPRCHRSMLP